MSYFTIHVKTGKEKHVLEQLMNQIKIQGMDLIESIVAPFSQIKKFVGKETAIQKLKFVASSYIFIKLKEDSFQIPASVYHFVKQIKDVLRVFTDNVPREEVEAFCFNQNLAYEEAEIEIQLDAEEEVQVTPAQEVEKVILEETSPVEVEEVEDISTAFAIISSLIVKGKEQRSNLVSKCRAFIQNKKQTLRFPLAIFLRTRDRIDPYHILDNKTITTHSFILPELIETLKSEIGLSVN